MLNSFTSNERDFRNFLSYFIKELFRLKMLFEFEPKEVADLLKEKKDYNKLTEIIKKSNDIRLMTIEEYEIYINNYIKKSKFPDIN